MTWIVVTALVVLGILGVNPTGLVAVLGAVTLAFSLAVQDILKNFFSGVYLLLERPFRVGDTIRVKDQTGVVENIGVRTTQLRTVDNVQVLVPNATVFGEIVSNQTFVRPPTPDEEHAAAADGHPQSAIDPSLRR
ncbi:MAG: mechanosensitive ion channel [Chloroflexi bacterium]|nr:mechanosensitive ion channel [Chloroflexota bacterium]